MYITLFEGARDTAPQVFEPEWPDLCEILAGWTNVRCHRSDKLDHGAMIPGLCVGSRSNANVRFLSALAADFDIGPDDLRYLGFHAFCDKLAREGLTFAAYTTTKNSASHNKFRVILPYASPVPVEHCRAAWHACNDKFQGAIDRSTKDPARLSFLPAAWVGNPFHDPTLGMVTLDNPFDAFRAIPRGDPILSAAEIAALDPVFSGAMNFASEPVGIAETPSSPKVGARRVSHSPAAPVLADADRASLSRDKGPDDPCWRMLSDLRRSPLVRPWMRDRLPQEQGSRDHRFLRACARNALKFQYPITTEALVALAEQFSRDCLHRRPPADLMRQAENALAWAFNNPAEPRQPDAGTQP
jgi:hypothetical protein